MGQYYAASSQWQGGIIHFDADESYHLARVVRKKVGDKILVFDGAGAQAWAEILPPFSPQKVTARIVEKVEAMESPRAVEIYLPIIKGPRMDWAVEKATELGATKIIPLLAEHVAVQKSDAKFVRWEKIILSAAKQCKRAKLPELSNALDLQTALAQFKGIGFWLSEKAQAANTYDLKDVSCVGIFSGPEGGFNEVEENQLRAQKNIHPVKISPYVLRAETAAVAGLSFVYRLFSKLDSAA